MVKLKHELAADDRLAESIEILAASFDRFTESVDRLTYMIEDLATRLGLDTIDERTEP